MSIERKLVTVGDSRGVSLPKLWLQIQEQTVGKKIVAVSMIIGDSITLRPIFDKKEIHCQRLRKKLVTIQ